LKKESYHRLRKKGVERISDEEDKAETCAYAATKDVLVGSKNSSKEDTPVEMTGGLCVGWGAGGGGGGKTTRRKSGAGNKKKRKTGPGASRKNEMDQPLRK